MENHANDWVLTRRTFLKTTAATATLMALGSWPSCHNEPEIALRAGLLTDTHFARRPSNNTRYYEESLAKLREAVELMNREKVDLAVHIGDFKDEDPEPVESRTLGYVSELEQAFSAFGGPRYHVLGNHDMDSISKEQFLVRVENTGIESGRSYYSFDQKGFHFIILDANFRQDGAPYDKGNFDWKDTNIPEDQLDWLRTDLAATQLPAIIFVHQLLDPEQTIEHRIRNGAAVRAVLEDAGRVLAVFQGHQHQGGYHLVNGIHYYTLPAMVEGSGPENSSYAILDIHSNGDLVLNGYRRATDREMPRS